MSQNCFSQSYNFDEVCCGEHNKTTHNIPVLVLAYYPDEDKDGKLDPETVGNDSANFDVNQMKSKVADLTGELVEILEYGSAYHGYKNPDAVPSLNYNVTESKIFDEPIPVSTEFRPFADHIKILNELDICDYVDNQGVKEVWIWMYHSSVVAPIESNMSGPYGDISNSYRQDDLPHCESTYTVYDYNYGRGASEATEDHMHQIESVMRHADNDLFWNKFVGPVGDQEGDRRCGWSHYPPNGETDYDWQNENYVATDCEDWKPDELGESQVLNCEKWNCDSLTFFKWWMQNLPGYGNTLTYSDKRLRNWWDFIGDFDEAMSKGKRLVFQANCIQSNISWNETTSLPQPMSASFLRGRELIIYDSRVYLFAGQNDDEARMTNVYYSSVQPNGTLGTWIETTPLPGQYFDHVVVRVGSYLYFISGADGATDVFYTAINPDGSLKAWTKTQSLMPSRQNFAAASHGKYIFVSGGNSGGTRDFVKFTSVNANGEISSWADTTPLPEPIEGHSMVAAYGHLYIVAVSGTVYYAPVNSDGTVGEWKITMSFPPKHEYASFEHGGYLHIVGGRSATGTANQPTYYSKILTDGRLDEWHTADALPTTLIRPYAGASDGFFYAICGHDGSNYQDIAYYGIKTFGCKNPNGDFSGNGKIGLEDSIGILRQISGQ